MLRRGIILSSLLLSLGCAGPDTLGTLNLKAWRNDRGGCKGDRQSQLANFQQVKDQLKGMHANDLGKYLGRPDVNQIEDRNQKYYVYYVEKGPQCVGDNTGAKSRAKSVALKVSAIGLVTEISVQAGVP
ncbi:hypothetical protein [Fibrella aquatilis]|uniref:Lipoprotein n=1 Tax=Fibrella aquatilis TaxID=2817059 RepID=A0A939G504_9BACT|nr:hypothetical protein [Fibrella aquatilis]MBO0932487.1 hypothetical protein [Fibrella aquatilis]